MNKALKSLHSSLLFIYAIGIIIATFYPLAHKSRKRVGSWWEKEEEY